jgi:hypothetical protein
VLPSLSSFIISLTRSSPLFKQNDLTDEKAMKRAAELRTREAGAYVPAANAVFDDSGHFLLFATPLGVKVINLHSNKLVRVLGRVENTERFTAVALFQGEPHAVGASAAATHGADRILAAGNAVSEQNGDAADGSEQRLDPTIFACAYKKPRFYVFTKREPADEGRWREDCASAVRVLCECCASAVRVLCEYCASAVRVLCECCASAVRVLF